MKFILVFIVVILAIPAQSADWIPVVLIAKSVETDSEGNLKIKLKSGDVLSIIKKDIAQDWTDAIVEAIKKQEAENAAESSDDPPSDQAASGIIRRKCEGEWANDFSMIKYCQDQQYDALKVLRSRKMKGPLSKIRSKCASEWSNDFAMRDYCEKQQLEAYRALQQ